MKKATIIIVLALLAVVLSGCCAITMPGARITGSGDLETREMDLSGFTGIAVANSFSVDIVQGDSFSVSVTADDNLFDYLEATVTGDTLRLGLRPGRVYNRTTLRAEVTMPAISKLDLSGASQGQVSGFDSAEPLNINLSGASELNGDIRAGDIRAGLSGASRLTLTGTGGDLSFRGSGASSADLAELTVSDANVRLSGASHATVNAVGTLTGELSGASNLYYVGSPALGRIRSSGNSSITAR